MKKFKIEIQEVRQTICDIEAETIEEALEIAEEEWYDGKIVLGIADFKEINIKEFKNEKEIK